MSELGTVARFLKKEFPNIKQLFVHARIYGGYAKNTLNPEPYAYEIGLATKWFVQAQINQINNGVINPVAGDLSYSTAPWIAWGPYFWGSGTTPRSDGLVWNKTDVTASDGVHPVSSGVKKVSDLMIAWYLSSPYTPWFRAQ
jgi:hypothetical protein